ncbi:MAG: DHH family phosphoesterase [Bacilli bacterium]|nr:DHH family phosphoesterase [Bacilli bacterium]
MSIEEIYSLIENRNLKDDELRNSLIQTIINNILNSCKNKEVYIIGHNNPDADSIISSYILSNILNSMGINSHFSILDKNYDYTFHDKKLLEENFKYQPEIVHNLDNYFILVDHNDLQGLKKENVLGAFDHHVIKYEIDNILEIEYASTSLLIYDLFKYKYEFSEEEKYLIGLATLSDTDYLTSTRFTDIDKELFDELNLKIDVKEYQKKYFITTNFSLGVEKNFGINKKEYLRNNKKITRIQITSYDDNELNNYINKAKELGYLLIWLNYDNNTTTIYYEDNIIKLNYLLSSTYLVFKLLEDRKKLVIT